MSNRKRHKMGEILYKYSQGWDPKSGQPPKVKGITSARRRKKKKRNQRLNKLQEETYKKTFY